MQLKRSGPRRRGKKITGNKYIRKKEREVQVPRADICSSAEYGVQSEVNVHMAMAWSASPMRTTRPALRRPLGGGKSHSSRCLTSVSGGTASASERKGSAHVCANERISSRRPALVAGNCSGGGGDGDGDGSDSDPLAAVLPSSLLLLKTKPSRSGHDTTICRL